MRNMNINTGGPAFPGYRYDGSNDVWDYGMTLMDWMAGQAIASIMSLSWVGPDDLEEVAKRAYLLSDQMLLARERKAE